MKMALINVVLEGDYQYEQDIPLGLASLGAFLRENGHEVEFHQCFAGRGGQETDGAAAREADVYGFQLNLVNYGKVRDVVKTLKARKPDAVTVFGGPFLITESEDVMTRESLFDFAVLGEGEYTMLELLKALKEGNSGFSKIKGLVWRDDGGRVVANEYRKPPDDLDALPFPARDLVGEMARDPVDNKIIQSLRMVSSRGCVGKCSFCCVNIVNKATGAKRWRGRSPSLVVDELETLSRRHGARLFNFSDSSFEDPGRLGKRRSSEICEEIIRRGIEVSLKIYMRCESVKGEEDVALLKLYKRAGVDVIIMGAESGSDYELELYQKFATVEDNVRGLNIVNGLGLFYLMVGIIMFGPDSTAATLRKNLEILLDTGQAPFIMNYTNALVLIKGSKLYNGLKKAGRVVESETSWSFPKYVYADPVGERMKERWSRLYYRYPVTREVNNLQVNTGNLISRMSNPMNAKALRALADDFLRLKENFETVNREIGETNSGFFRESLEEIENGCPDADLERREKEIFDHAYRDFLKKYSSPYNSFIEKVRAEGFSLSGLVFQHFYSAIMTDGRKLA